jgi:NAD(P)H-hydrate epimerase
VGPGNNGGDGLVAARHLKMMNYHVDLVLFKTLKGKCENLLKLCEDNDIKAKMVESDFGLPETEEAQKKFMQHMEEHDFIIDGIFGFPFTGEIRPPYNYFLPLLSPFGKKILSVDIPSGWDANLGNVHNLFTPQYLVALSIPKKCCENFNGEHYLGGRFIPEKIKK